MVFETLLPVVLLASGLSAGVLMSTQLGGWPLLRSLPVDRYVQAHAFFSTRYDPFMPICLISTAVGDAVLAALVAQPIMRVLFVTAGLSSLCAVLISITKNAPVNRWMQTLDPQNLPADFSARDPRPRWGGWNRRRSVLSVAAFALNCLAVGMTLAGLAG